MSAAAPEAARLDARVDRLRAAAEAAGLEAMLVTSDASIAYLAGLWGMQFERLFAVVVRVAGGGALVVPRLDEAAAGRAPSGLDRVAYDAASDGLPELEEALGGARRVGVEETHLHFGRARALEARGCVLEEAGALVMALRARKDAQELEGLRHACAVVTEVMERMFAALRPGDVESAVNAQVDFWLRERGATQSHPLVLFGPNAADPHGAPGPRELAPGDVVCADVSAQVGGYWGDLTRCGTVGPPSAWAREAWEVVRAAQEAAIAVTRAGSTAREVDAAQREIVEGAGGLGRCLHGAGHAIGLEIHEPPFLVPRDGTTLAPGMVFTVEPGLYRTGTGGIRIEDCVVAREDGPELLSDLPASLREIAA